MMFYAADSNEALKRKLFRATLVLSIAGLILLTILHRMENNPHPTSLVIPPIMIVLSVILLIRLDSKPNNYQYFSRLFFIVVMIALVSVAWVLSLEAHYSADKILVDILPPITSVLFLLTMGMVIFEKPAILFPLLFILWLGVATPVLVYFIFHLDELKTARGIEIVVSLGPFMAINMVLVYFHAHMQNRVNILYSEKSRLKQLSETDPLTGVYNRRTGELLLTELIVDQSKQLGIIFFDIDHFKSINDRYGHFVGDSVLCEVVRRSSDSIRKDDMLVRWGGEEFLVVIRDVLKYELSSIAEHVRKSISTTPVMTVGIVTASFGASCKKSSDNFETLLQRADEALYLAKNQGRNQVVVKL